MTGRLGDYFANPAAHRHCCQPGRVGCWSLLVTPVMNTTRWVSWRPLPSPDESCRVLRVGSEPRNVLAVYPVHGLLEGR